MKSLSLVLFSVLTQAAVGLVLVAAVLPGGSGGAAARLAVALGALGLCVSLAHLGTPSGALRALANLRSSWLSREVLLTGLFTGAAVVYAFLLPAAPVGLVAGLLGLAALYAQGMVYQLPARPEWRHGANLWSLFASALQVGALVAALTADHSLLALRYLGALTLVASVGVLLAAALWAMHLVRIGRGAVLSDTWFWVRLVAGVLLPLLAGTAIYLGMEPDLLTTGGALAGALTAEVLGRSLFYRVGLEQSPLF